MDNLIGREVEFLYKTKVCDGIVVKVIGELQPNPQVHSYVIAPKNGIIMQKAPWCWNTTATITIPIENGIWPKQKAA